MEIIQWSEKYSVGINEIDNQHKGLVILINELFTLMSEGKAKANMEDVFNHLTDYTKKHFYTEEAMIIKYAFPEYKEHKSEHNSFIEHLSQLKEDFRNEKNAISVKVLNFLKDWLLNHIMISDQKYSPFITDKY